MEVVVLYLGGVVLGWIIVNLVETSCETCTQQICDSHPEQVSAYLPDWVWRVGTVLVSAVGVLFVSFWVLHRQRVKKSRTYQSMLRAAEDYHVQCHAAIPNSPSAEHYSESWRAEPLSVLDLVRVLQIKVWSVNIVGVGFPLYCSAMLSFLQLCVVYWVGNGISMGLFLDVVETACLPFDHRSGANRAEHDLALDRTMALTRLFVVSTVFHWLHAKHQRVYAREFDDRHMEMHDYALLVDGFPEDATSEKVLAKYLQDACNRYTPELPLQVVGTSICFDFHEDLPYVQGLVEDELMHIAATSLQSPKKRSESNYESMRHAVHEVRMAWLDGLEPRELEARDISPRSGALNESSSEESFSSSWSPETEVELLEDQGSEARQRLRQLRNSGRVFAVFRYPVNDEESARHLQAAVDMYPFDKHKLEVRLIGCDPPSIVFEHCVVGVHTRQPLLGCIWLTKRERRLAWSNFKILLCCSVLVLGYYFLYSRVYRQQMRAKTEDFIMTTLVTISASVGNIIINQIVWSSAMDVGYRFKVDRDAYVFRWYTVITLINTVFNFGVITATFSKKPDDHLQQVLYEAALGQQLSVFIRGSLVSYAIFPVFYILLWLKGRMMLLWEYWSSEHRDQLRLRHRAEQAMEPPEWWLQYDYAAIVVMMTTSTFCLFVHGNSVNIIFTLDVIWAIGMIFINRYVYLALSRETYFSTDRLDATASRAQAVPLAMVGVCILHWAGRSGHKPMTRFLFALVVVVSVIFVCFLHRETRGHTRMDKRYHVWYEGRPYEEAERTAAFNWWNVNPVFCLRAKFGLLEEKWPKCRTTMWRAGKSHLQPQDV